LLSGVDGLVSVVGRPFLRKMILWIHQEKLSFYDRRRNHYEKEYHVEAKCSWSEKYGDCEGIFEKYQSV
jgi:hypothetical protein